MSKFSVTTPATELSLLTLAELRAATGISSGQDAELMVLGRAVSTAIARQCNVVDDGVNPPTLLQETITEIFRWTGCGPLPLARRPVTSITSVDIDGEAVDAADYEIVGRNLYALTDDEITEWTSGKITVVYVAGYPTAQADMKMAASKLVTSTSAESGRDPSLKRVDIPGVIEEEYWVGPTSDPLLSREIADLLSPYRERFV